MTTSTFTISAIQQTLISSVVDAAFALNQAQEKSANTVNMLAASVKEALAAATDLPTWESIRRPIVTELAKRYMAKGCSKETGTNNADAKWSDVVARCAVEKPKSTESGAQRKAKHDDKKKQEADAVAKLAEGKSADALFKESADATEPEAKIVLMKAAQIAMSNAQKEAEKRVKSAASDAKKDVVKVLSGLPTDKTSSEHTQHVCRVMLAAAEHGDMVGAMLANKDAIIAAQIAFGETNDKGLVLPMPASKLIALALATLQSQQEVAGKPARARKVA